MKSKEQIQREQIKQAVDIEKNAPEIKTRILAGILRRRLMIRAYNEKYPRPDNLNSQR